MVEKTTEETIRMRRDNSMSLCCSITSFEYLQSNMLSTNYLLGIVNQTKPEKLLIVIPFYVLD